mmetsp:Transcript_29918/g.41664  ORF Transcript_29918/g.41664 Transcript_29918/m.41664 type:complete len:113 (+) Transcript_29918:325-663(+)
MNFLRPGGQQSHATNSAFSALLSEIRGSRFGKVFASFRTRACQREIRIDGARRTGHNFKGKAPDDDIVFDAVATMIKCMTRTDSMGKLDCLKHIDEENQLLHNLFSGKRSDG